MVGKTALALALFGAFGWTGPMGKGTGSDLAFDSHQTLVQGRPAALVGAACSSSWAWSAASISATFSSPPSLSCTQPITIFRGQVGVGDDVAFRLLQADGAIGGAA
jgi:hypothetical protein